MKNEYYKKKPRQGFLRVNTCREWGIGRKKIKKVISEGGTRPFDTADY